MKIGNDIKYLVQFSSKGKQHNEEVLADHLLQLLEIKKHQDTNYQNSALENDTKLAALEKNPSSLIGKGIVHTWFDAVKKVDEKWHGRIQSYNGGLFQVNTRMTVQNLKTNSPNLFLFNQVTYLLPSNIIIHTAFFKTEISYLHSSLTEVIACTMHVISLFSYTCCTILTWKVKCALQICL